MAKLFNLDALIQEGLLTDLSIAALDKINVAQYAFRTQSMKGVKSIKIWGVVPPTVTAFTGAANVTKEALLDTQKTLDLTQKDYIFGGVEKIDDWNSFQSRLEDWAVSAADGFAEKVDTYAFTTLATGTNKIADVTALDSTNIYATVTAIGTKLTNQKCPRAGRRLFVSPEVSALMAQDVIRFTAGTGEEPLRTGFVGNYAGFEVFESIHLPASTQVGGHKIIFGLNPAGNDLGTGLDEIGVKEANFDYEVYGTINYGAVISQPAFIVEADIKLA